MNIPQYRRLCGIFVVIVLALVACTGSSTPPAATDIAQPVASDTAQPAATETAQPAATETAQPAATETAEPAATETAEPAATETAPPATTAVETIDPVAFHQAMRKLWMDHVSWTRLYIVSAVADLPGNAADTERLLQNQADIGEAIAAFYGEEAGAALTGLLEEHILIAAELVTAAKNGDQAAADTANTAWQANADEIAAFLAGANPAWPEETLRDMMYTHLEQTLAEATAQLEGDYPASVAEYDSVVAHILEMADVLAAGIVTQFPERFSEPSLSDSALALNDTMRNLWHDHVFWTRLYIVSAVADLPGNEADTERLLQNQTDIGEAVAGFYGEEAGAALTGLLEEHILIAAELVTAAKNGDQAAVDTANTAWQANADEIAAFLAGANPAWPEETLRDMMYTHLEQTLAEATAQLEGDYPASVAEYDGAVAHILEMADALAAGIVTQFPEQFEE